MHDEHRIQENRRCSQPSEAFAIIARLERRLERLERLLDEGIGAFLDAKFPYGDQRTNDRWGRGRR